MKVEKIYSKEKFTTNYTTGSENTINKVEDTAPVTDSLSPNKPKGGRYKTLQKIAVYSIVLALGLVLGKFIFSKTSTNIAATTTDTEASATHQEMWTCSMHPQIMQPEFGDCPLCGMDLIVAEQGNDGLSPNQFKLTKNAIALANIQTTTVGEVLQENENNTVGLSGKVVVNEEVNAIQVSHLAGRIEKLYINYVGEKVSRGQRLASIYSPELFSAQQELLTAVHLKEAQPELYKAVRNKLKLWKFSNSQIDAIETANKVQENISIYATESGTVTEKLAERGDYVAKGQPLLKLANYQSVWADFDIYEHQISAFKEGQSITVKAKAFPNKTFSAKVTYIDPVVDVNKRTVTLRTKLTNKKGLLKPGMFVNGEVQVEKNDPNQAIKIPATAIMWTGKRSVVYVKTNPDEPVFEMREVLIGNQSNSMYEILGGLKSGEEVVTNGVFTVDASAQLLGKQAMMNHTKGTIEMPKKRFKVSAKFKKQLNTAVNTYITIKDALIQHDSLTVFKTSEKLKTNLSKINSGLLNETKAKEQWKTLNKVMSASANTMQNTTNLSVQRKQFKSLSAHLIEAVETFGVNKTLYSQYCPMADNDTGGYWLSTEEKILNPYFGDMMLSCGEVKQTIEYN